MKYRRITFSGVASRIWHRKQLTYSGAYTGMMKIVEKALAGGGAAEVTFELTRRPRHTGFDEPGPKRVHETMSGWIDIPVS